MMTQDKRALLAGCTKLTLLSAFPTPFAPANYVKGGTQSPWLLGVIESGTQSSGGLTYPLPV